MAALQELSPRDEQIIALNRRTANLRADRLQAFREEILRSYEAHTIVGQVSRVAEVLDRTPSDFRVISNSERRRLAHFNDPTYHWDMYCSELARSVALGEETYLFECLAEVVDPCTTRVSAGEPDFAVVFEQVYDLKAHGHNPDVLCAPISLMVPFLTELHPRLTWGSDPGEALTAPDGSVLRVFWSSKIAPLDRFVIFDSAGAVWNVKPDPESGHRLTVAIGEPEEYPDSVVWLAETVAKFEIADSSAFRAILLEGEPKPLEEQARGG